MKRFYILAFCMALSGAAAAQTINWDLLRAFAMINQERKDTTVVASHTPLYPRTGQTVTYTAAAIPPDGLGIKKIRVSVVVYTVSESGGLLSYNGTPVLDTGLECQWNVEPYPTTPQVCTTDPIDLPENSYVWYSGVVTLSDDTVRKDRRIRHAAKLSSDVIAAYNGAIPVYRRGLHGKKFDILFTRDVDFSGFPAFINEMGQYVWTSYFGGALLPYRRYMNIYMNDFANSVDIENPDGNGCSDHTIYENPDMAAPNADEVPWVDVHVFAHLNDFQDCSHIRLGGGSESSTDNGTTTVTAHETLHSLAGLDDEYRTSDADEASSDAVGPHFNTFVSLEECYDHAQADHAYDYWWKSSQCRIQATDSLLYHWDNDSDIMTSTSTLSFEEIAQLDELIDDQNLSAFSKTPEPALRQTGRELSQETLKEAQQSIEDDFKDAQLEKQARSLKMKLVFSPNRVALKDVRVTKGPAPNLFLPNHPSDYLVSLLDNRGTLVQKFYTPDPRRGCDGEPLSNDHSGNIDSTSFDFRVNFDPRIALIQVQDKTGRVLLNAPLSPGKTVAPATAPAAPAGRATPGTTTPRVVPPPVRR